MLRAQNKAVEYDSEQNLGNTVVLRNMKLIFVWPSIIDTIIQTTN